MGWNGSDKSFQTGKTGKDVPKTLPSGKMNWKPIFAGLASIAVIGTFVFLFISRPNGHGNEANNDSSAPARTLMEVKPSKSAAPADIKPQVPKSERPTVDVLGKTPTGEAYVAVEASTNSSGVVESLYTLADGSKKRVVQLQSRDTLVFDNDFDNMLGLIGTTPLDQKLPPMPDLGDMEEQFKKAMKSPILIHKEDSNQAKKMKQATLDLRLKINDLMREGYTLTQILSEYESLREINVKERHKYQADLNEIYNSGDIEGARVYLEKANAKLEEVGIIPLTMPGEGSKRRIVQ